MSFEAEMDASQNPARPVINTEGISFEPRPQPTPIGTPAICLFRQFNQRPDWAMARGRTSGLIHNDDGQGRDGRLYRGTAEQSGALFVDNGTLRDPRSAGGANREREYFGQCRRHLPGAASVRLASQAAGIASAARRPPA
jgi:hypothetical protein